MKLSLPPRSALLCSALLLCALAAPRSTAAPQTFDFKDPKGVNNVVFKLDAPLEAINGTATGISGKVTFDPDKPAQLTGQIVVQTGSMQVGNTMMQEHMLGEQWMDANKHQELAFDVTGAANVRKDGEVVHADVTGNLTLHGITRPITVPVKLTYLKDKLSARMPNAKGDLLVIRSTFKIKRSDFGINPAAPQDKVSDDVELVLSLAGACPAK